MIKFSSSIVILVSLTLVHSTPINDIFDIDNLQYDDTFPIDYVKESKFIPGFGGRITGGEEAVPNSFPYQIALSLRKIYGITTLCGGSLISDRVILTAAHCLHETSFGFASFGAHDLRKPSRRVKIENFIIHPDFDPTTLNNDVALIKLDEPVTLDEKIQLIKLPTNDDLEHDTPGTQATATGWGKFSDDSKFTSNVLRFVHLLVLPPSECLQFYENIVVREENLCTNGKFGKSTCSGDSGGPLVIENNQNEKIQIGISSFGSQSGCETGYPAVFTRTAAYLDWITENMN